MKQNFHLSGLFLLMKTTNCDVEYFSVYNSTTDICPSGHSEYKGKCYRFYREESVIFPEAEAYCNTLNEGHVVAYHSAEDYEFLKSLIGNYFSGVWIGLKKETNTMWKFTDGSTHDYNPGAHTSDGLGEPCFRIRDNPLIPVDVFCDRPAYSYPYICQSQPLDLPVSVQADKSGVFSEAFDNNSDTCGRMEESHGTRMYVQTGSNSSETLRSVMFNVTYKKDVLCYLIRVLFIEVSNPRCSRFKPCDSTKVAPSTCDVSCPCDRMPCDIVFLNFKQIEVCDISIADIL